MELPQIGNNCASSNCKQLDFLPFKCPLCGLEYCLEHRLPTLHQCSKWESANKTLSKCSRCLSKIFTPSSILTSDQALEEHIASGCQLYVFETSPQTPAQPCNAEGCNVIEKIVGGVRCDGCSKTFCLKHRHPFSHDCPSLTAHLAISAQKRQAAQEIIQKAFKKSNTEIDNSEATSSTVTPKRPAKKESKTIAMMKMKSKAQGDSSIPMESRIYLNVTFPSGSNLDPRPLFFNKTWTIGRTLDQIATVGKLPNVNNTVEQNSEKRLHLFKLPSLSVLANDHRLEDELENTDQVMLETTASIIAP